MMRQLAWWSTLALVACGNDDAADPPPADEGWFVDRRASSGVDFVHRPGTTGQKRLPEINGGCVALLDVDQDGHLDLFFGQGAALPDTQQPNEDFRDRLYRRTGPWQYEDVTDATGASDDGYTFHAAAPDFDGDGDPDLYLCNLGRNTWKRNDEGTFVDVTDAWGAGHDAWSTCPAFFDADRDGDLDLYLVNYVDYPLDHPGCGELTRGEEYRAFCSPKEFPGADDRFYRCDGGVLVDVSAEVGLVATGGSGLQALAWDADEDGWGDVFVANDGRPNFLWRNPGAWDTAPRFVDIAGDAGVAVAANGQSEASMGCDLADVDFDGDLDLLIANLAMETNTLYRNEGGGLFDDRSTPSGLGVPSLRYVGFGCEFFDADLDGAVDVMITNGHILDNVALIEPSQSFRQPPNLYFGDGRGRFTERGAECGPYFQGRWVGRGLAVGDLDGDGDFDAVVAHNAGPPAVLEWTRPSDHHWIAVALEGRGRNRDALGAVVRIVTPDRTWTEPVLGASSYAAFNDLRVRVGLGSRTEVTRIDVTWPDGTQSRHEAPAVDQVHTITQPDA